jgi:hypothetical protein
VGENALGDEADEAFGEGFNVFERGVSHFRLDHPELGEVAPGLRLFGAEGGAEAVDFAEGHGVGFVVELPGLGEIDLFVLEVVDLEQGGGAFAGGGGEDGAVDEGEAVVVEIVAGGFDDLVAHLADGVLAAGAEPEVAVVHQEVDAVFLGVMG